MATIKAQARQFLKWRASQEKDAYAAMTEEPERRSLIDGDGRANADFPDTDRRQRKQAFLIARHFEKRMHGRISRFGVRS